MSDGATQVAVGCENGRAVLRFPRPIDFAAFDPENGRLVAEALARACYEAHYGRPPPDNVSAVGTSVRAKATSEMRDRMVNRIALMLGSMRENKGVTNGRLALELVDRIFADVL